MEGEIKTLLLVFVAHPESDHRVKDLEQHEAHHEGVCQDCDDTGDLSDELRSDSRIPVAESRPAEGLGAENSREHRAHDARDAMDGEYVKGIVIAERRLDPGRGEETDGP